MVQIQPLGHSYHTDQEYARPELSAEDYEVGIDYLYQV